MATMDDPPIPPIRNVSARDKEPAKNGSRQVDKKAGFFKKDKKSAGGEPLSLTPLSLSLIYMYTCTCMPLIVYDCNCVTSSTILYLSYIKETHFSLSLSQTQRSLRYRLRLVLSTQSMLDLIPSLENLR